MIAAAAFRALHATWRVFRGLLSAWDTSLSRRRRLSDSRRRVIQAFLARPLGEPKTGTVISPPSLCPCSCHGEQFTGHSP